jgi:hypothetical protein
MRNLNLLETYRDRSPDVLRYFGNFGDHETGTFLVPSCTDRQPLRVIASAGEGWDHVSVSRPTRCPNWPEMEQVKRLFFKDDETAMQLHVPPSDHISHHPYCLHLWRPQGSAIPRPPAWMVGPAKVEA